MQIIYGYETSNISIIHEIFANSSILPRDRTLTGTTIPVQSGLGINIKERLLQICRNGALPQDAVYCHTQHTSLIEGLIPLLEEVSLFYSPTNRVVKFWLQNETSELRKKKINNLFLCLYVWISEMRIYYHYYYYTLMYLD